MTAGDSTAAVFAVPGRAGVRLAHSDPISALAWYPPDTGIFFSAGGTKVLVWDANAAQAVTAAAFDDTVFDLAPRIVSGRPIVAGLPLVSPFIVHTPAVTSPTATTTTTMPVP